MYTPRTCTTTRKHHKTALQHSKPMVHLTALASAADGIHEVTAALSVTAVVQVYALHHSTRHKLSTQHVLHGRHQAHMPLRRRYAPRLATYFKGIRVVADVHHRQPQHQRYLRH